MNVNEAAAKLGFTAIPVGSRVTCDPAPTDTDADYLALVDPQDFRCICNELMQDDWDAGGSLVEDDDGLETVDRATFRMGDENLILTNSQAFFDCFMACTAIAKRMNLLRKEDRVALFDEARKHWPGVFHAEHI